MKKKNQGSVIGFFIIFIILLLIGGGIFVYWYLQSQEVDIPKFVGNFISANQEEVVNQVEQNVQNPLNNLNSTSNDTVTVDGYYYQQLNNEEKAVYKALEQNIENLKTGTYTIELGDRFSNILEQENGSEQLNTIYQNSLDAFTMDHPEIFYLDITKMIMVINTKTGLFNTTYDVQITKDSNLNYLIDGFQNKQEVDQAIALIEQVKSDILSHATGTDYDKIKYVHDWLVENVTYDETLTKPHIRDAYGTLVNKEAVCEGYAETFQMLMNELNIPSIMIVGTGTNSEGQTEAHAWNYVQLEGKWYGVDTTWDDPIIIGGGRQTTQMKTKYLVKGSNAFNGTHYPTGQVSGVGKTFTYPALESSDY